MVLGTAMHRMVQGSANFQKKVRTSFKKHRQARKEIGLIQVEVAKKLKRPQSYISKWEASEQRIDVKEFTNWSNSFTDFVHESIIPKIDIYNLIIATYRKIDGDDLKFLVDCLNEKKISSRIWIVASPTEENDNNEISHISIIDRDGLVYDKTINLSDWIDKDKPRVVYQDVVRFVSPSSKE